MSCKFKTKQKREAVSLCMGQMSCVLFAARVETTPCIHQAHSLEELAKCTVGELHVAIGNERANNINTWSGRIRQWTLMLLLKHRDL